MTDIRALVITSPPDSKAVAPHLVAELWDCTPNERRVEKNWLGEDRNAAEILAWTDEEYPDEVHFGFAEDMFRGHAVDVNMVVAGDHRRKRLFVADMESTIIEQEMIDELADYVGKRDEIERITARAMRGELEFEGALRERVAMLAGLDASVLDEVYERRVTLMPGAETLIHTMKANGAYCALVSGGFTVFTSRVAARLGFDEHQANVLEIEDGKLTGAVKEPILGRHAKRVALERLTKKLKLDPAETLAVGDGANDLAMLAAAGLGVAFRAKPKVQEAARAMANGAVITHGDLTALLYLQGYRHDEFVE